jgi:hypothetical protein
MRTALWTVVILAAAVAGAAVWAHLPLSAQAESYTAPRTADGVPDLNGVWQALNTANYDITVHPARPAPAVRPLGAVGGVPAGAGVVEGNEIPYQEWALAKKKENADHWLERDPEIKCFMPGVPRATYMPYPFQILQSTNKILIAYEFAGATRTIHLDKVADSPSPSWMGWSRGRWDGDSLVVDVTDFNEETWFDRAGNFHSDALHVVERYTPVSPHHLMYEVSIEDPKVFTRPWKMRMPLYRRFEPDTRILEYKCVEFVEQLMYGQLGVIDPATGTINK